MDGERDIHTEELQVPGEGRALDAYLAGPVGGDGLPALIVVHEIWGLDDHIRDVTRRFAREGYVALAPELYTREWREAMPPDRILAGMQFMRQTPQEILRDPARLDALLSERSEEERRALRTLMHVRSSEQQARFARDLRSALRALGERPEVNAECLACLGFCMGGGLAARLATLAPELRAVVIFYGANPPLEQVPDIQAAVLGVYGGEDHRITGAVPDFERAMAQAGKSFTYHVYPGAQHAFFNDTRPSYDRAAAEDAWRRVLDFLGGTLRPSSVRV